MLDLVMAARRAGVAAYKEAWARTAGTPMDEWLAATGEAWGDGGEQRDVRRCDW
ncbi:hypothetical protein [Streptomyces sp. SID13031]|uniref:hypothetical protein n=1 Tax=Streptomyces sp. SID13031 TaxID=2706046 RepID=UPI0013CC2FF1|nr:hypothetical protein [Streptomyces sp. SID13031]NEA36811.1 hypothetical protein [Streptomyces sp. SID13031]